MSSAETILPPRALAPADPPVRFGILGAARITRRLAPAIRMARGAELVAVASRDPSAARAKADEWDCRAYVCYDDLLADPDVDAVYIPLPNGLHAHWCERALDAGKMVLCEKALVATPEDLERVRRALARTGGWLEETFQYRHHPLTDWAVAWARSEAAGALRAGIVLFELNLEPGNIRWDQSLGGGVSFDLTCYGTGLWRMLTGEEPVEARAQRWEWTDGPSGPVDATIDGWLYFPSGLQLRVSTSYRAPRYHSGWVLQGEEQTLLCQHDFAYNTHDSIPRQHLKVSSRSHSLEEALARPTTTADAWRTVAMAETQDCYRLMIEECAARWRAGEPPRWGVADASANLAALWALRESARLGGTSAPVEATGSEEASSSDAAHALANT